MKRAMSFLQRNIIEHLALAGNLMRNPKFWVVLVTDTLLLLGALYLAYYLRYEQLALDGPFDPYLHIFFVIVAVKLPVFYVFGLYSGLWRYTGVRDVVNIVKAICLSSVLLLTVLLYMNRFAGFSRSIFILDMIFTFLFVTGNRMCIRSYYNGRLGVSTRGNPKRTLRRKRLLLIGAGDVAEKVVRELRSNPDLPYDPVGLLDDDLNTIGRRIHGIQVMGTVANLEKHLLRTKAQEVLITVSSPGSADMKRFVELCTRTRVPFKVIPQFSEIIDGNVSIRSIRDISYRDLLGRKEVRLESERIWAYLGGTTILVTGAGGSIGSELCRQLMCFNPACIVLFDASEENLYSIEMELAHQKKETEVIAVLGQIQDVHLTSLVFERYRPSVVFHCAAYKHVPLVERNPWEAVTNNILATRTLVEASVLCGVERFVLISTDKAVRPTSVMGASKRCTELLLKAYERKMWDGSVSKEMCTAFCQRCIELMRNRQEHKTRFMAVRFGNVLGSSGSVIPLFARQIEQGGPVTVTHPDISRFFMLVEEAAQLTLQAGAMGDGGEIFILNMGRPIKIERMARDLIKLAGKEPDSEIAIRYTSLRDGEKLHEELITVGEGIVQTGHDKIMVLQGNGGMSCAELNVVIDKLAEHARRCDGLSIKLALGELIKEYVPDLEAKPVYGTVEPFSSEEIAARLPN